MEKLDKIGLALSIVAMVSGILTIILVVIK